MSNEFELTYFKMKLLQAEIRMNSIVAENKMKEMLGEPPIYLENDFINIIEEYGIYHNAFPDERK